MSRLTLRLASIALALAITAPAAAQNLAIEPPARPPGAYRIMPRWDTYAFGGGESGAGTETRVTTWANVFSAQLDFDFVVARLAIPLAYSSITTTVGPVSSSTDQAALGNIELEGLASIDLGPEHRLLIGGGIALPTATDQFAPGSAVSSRSRGARGLSWVTSFRNAAAWQEHAFTLWPTAEYRFTAPWVLVTASAALPVFFPTSSDFGGPLVRGNVELMMTLDVTGAVRILEIIDVGASFLAWALPSGAGYEGGILGEPDLGQTALTLFVRTDQALDAPVGGGFEMIFDLDNGWGPTGEEGRFWGAHLFLYGRFDGELTADAPVEEPATY